MTNSADMTMDQPSSNRSTKEIPLNTKWWQTTRAKRVGAVSLLFAILGIIAWRFFFYPFVSTDDARVAMTVVRIAPAGIGGRIIKVNATEGTRVKEGDTLVELDHRVPQAEVDRAKSKADFAEKEFKRMRQLVAQRTATAQNFDTASSNYEAAIAELKKAEVALENTYLKSPFSGIVIQKLAEVGNILDPGQTAMSVADADHAWISANIEETSVGKVALDQPVTVSIDEGGKLYGKVTEIRSAAASQFALIPSDNASGNFTKVVQRIPIKVTIDPGQSAALRVGQSVEIKVRVH